MVYIPQGGLVVVSSRWLISGSGHEWLCTSLPTTN